MGRAKGHVTELRNLEESLASVTEDHIVIALRNALDLLHQACCAQVPGLGDSGEKEDAIRYRVECLCCILKRGALLTADSDYILEEVSRALQEKLFSRAYAASAVLVTHISAVLSVPPAFTLLLRSLPTDPQLQSSFYTRLLEEMDSDPAALTVGAKVVEHVRRELRKLTQGPPGAPHLENCSINIGHAPHLPLLLQLALFMTGNAGSAEDGEADTLFSRVSDSTQLRRQTAGARPRGGRTRAARPAPQVRDSNEAVLRAAGAVLRVLGEPGVLMAQLGLAEAEDRNERAPQCRSHSAHDCLAELLGGVPPSPAQAVPVSERLTTAMHLIELLISTIFSNPQVAWRIEGLARSSLTPASGSEHLEDTLAPVSAASNRGTCPSHQPLRAANPVGLDGKPLLPKPAEARLKQLALDLLGLHFALSQLQGQRNGSSAKKQRRLLGESALKKLAAVVLHQMLEDGTENSTGSRRKSTRGSGVKKPRARDTDACIPPEVAGHLVGLLREPDRREADIEGPAGHPEASSAHRDLQSTAELALAFCTASFKGPQPLLTYQCRHPSFQALRRTKLPEELGTPTPREGDEHSPGGNEEEREEGSVGRPNKRQKTTAAVETATESADANTQQSQTPGSKGAPKAARRIVPVQVSAEEAAKAEILPSDIPDQLLTDKDLAWFEGMIETKMQFTKTILQDLVEGDEEEDTLLGPSGGFQARGSPKGGIASMLGYSVNSDPAFREWEWQSLHSIALSLLLQALRGLASGGGDASTVWQVLEREEVWKDDEHMAMLGSRIMDPSMGAGPRFLAAKKGTKALPHECVVLGVASRLAQYCIGKGQAVSPALAGNFLHLLNWLMELCEAELRAFRSPQGMEQVTRPVKLAGNIVMACIERGSLRYVPLEPADIPAVLRGVLPALDPPDALLHVSAALWAAPQSWLSADAFRKFPSCLGGCSQSWIATWMKLPSSQHVKATCGELVSQSLELLLTAVAALSGAKSEAKDPDYWLEGLVALSAAVKGLCQGTIERGKALTTKATLRNSLAVAALLLKCTAAASATVRNRLQEASAAQQETAARQRPGKKPTRKTSTPAAAGGKTRSSIKQAAQAVSSAPQGPEVAGSITEVAAVAGAGAGVAAACRKLLEWRQRTCVGCERRLAEALADCCLIQEGEWARLAAERARSPGSSCLVEVEDGLGRVLAGEDGDEQDPKRALPQGKATAGDTGDSASGSGNKVEEKEAKKGCSSRPRLHKNAYMRAVQAEERRMGYNNSEDESSFSDLEDFIVCKQERDYGKLIETHFKYTTGRGQM